MLILDLDDTIFQTSSMNPEIFDSAISIIKDYYRMVEPNVNIEKLVEDLWSIPIDGVFSKYKTPQKIITKFYQEIAKVNFNKLEIKPFDDYKEMESISSRKFLVTTGLKELQLAKIKALGIESHFEKIYIDDPREKPRRHKINIFKEILKETQKAAQEIWVIGDNPESEIKAGKALKMKTIQRRSSTKQSSAYSDFEIDTFQELKSILNQF